GEFHDWHPPDVAIVAFFPSAAYFEDGLAVFIYCDAIGQRQPGVFSFFLVLEACDIEFTVTFIDCVLVILGTRGKDREPGHIFLCAFDGIWVWRRRRPYIGYIEIRSRELHALETRLAHHNTVGHARAVVQGDLIIRDNQIIGVNRARDRAPPD